jgi:ribonuclease D
MTNKINLIADQSALSAFCKNIAGSEYITVDTEFLRESTFWPKLCLVQVATPNYSGIIDPLANNMDLKPLLDIMADPSVKKVFHAGRQDMEIFYRLMKRTPAPVFDTQIAAMVCGYGDQI